MPFDHENAAALGARGGSVSSKFKRRASRENGKLGGRPPKLPPVPDGFPPTSMWEDAQWRYITRARRFPEYVAELCARRNISPEPVFKEEEIRDTLRRMGRYDLVFRRRVAFG